MHRDIMTEGPEQDTPPFTLLIKWAEMASRSQLEAAIRPWRLSSGQLLLLSTLIRLGPSSSADLARALHLTPQAMTTLLKPLEERRLIQRCLDPTNRRRLSLSLSDAGQALITEMKPTTDAVDRSVHQPFGAEEIEQLRRLLARIAAPPGG